MSQFSDRSGSGRCACGVIQFNTAGPPKFVANCHCADCRKATGAAFSTWVGYRDDQVSWSGKRTLYESSPGVSRGYCAACGSPLTYQGAKWPGEIHILIGAFDQPDAFTPKGDVFAGEALPWARPDTQD